MPPGDRPVSVCKIVIYFELFATVFLLLYALVSKSETLTYFFVNVGAALVYHPTYIQFANKRTLGGALGLSAGVMLYVSFIEIFSKSQKAFEDSGQSEQNSYLYATLCFFFGFVFMLVLNKVVHYLDPEEIGHQDLDFEMVDALEKTLHDDDKHPTGDNDVLCSDISLVPPIDEESGIALGSETQVQEKELGLHNGTDEEENLTSIDASSPESTNALIARKQFEAQQKLERMGLVTALAIGIHNFPEGLATFVATLDDPTVGVALAVAIGIHNIPEGVCVAMPIFFATGNRHKAFLWAVISGISEVVAAGLGWLVLSQVLGDIVYAILFGCVSGMFGVVWCGVLTSVILFRVHSCAIN